MTTTKEHQSGLPFTVIFTDLDGTLLDHHSYRAEAAEPVVRRLYAQGVPVVFCSSKTLAEQMPIRRELGVEAHPFIVENGSAIIAPTATNLAGPEWESTDLAQKTKIKVLGLKLADILPRLDRIRQATGETLRGYQQMSIAEVAAITGLSETGAALARQRDFSETIVDQMDADRWARVQAACEVEGLHCAHGGRFHTVTGAGADKGEAVRQLTQRYNAMQGPVHTIALGDSANDAPMLAAVDEPWLIARADGTWADLKIEGLHHARAIGPDGWVEAINACGVEL